MSDDDNVPAKLPTRKLWGAVAATSLPAIVMAMAASVTAFSFWQDDVEIVGFGFDPIVLGSWLVIACVVGTFVASRRRANVLKTFAAIFLVHLACLTMIFVPLILATLSSM